MREMRIISLALLALFSLAAFAQEDPIVADRPGLADGSSTVGRRVLQLESGITHESDDETSLTLPVLLRYGLTDAFELRVASDIFGRSSGNTDVGPIAAGFKWRLRGGDMPLSLIASVQPPSGGGSLRTSEFESEARLVSDIDLGNGLGFTPNVGVAFVEGGDATAIVAATLEKELGNLLPFVDFEAVMSGGDLAMIVDGGFAWIVRPDTQLDLSGGIDVAGDAYPEWFIAAGYSRRF
jgi:Putative MetA-pathway of phenol degradation